MPQNRSSAVMQQRVEPPDSFDDFPTPPWAARALCEWLQREGYADTMGRALDPACNRGQMVRALSEYFTQAQGADIFDYGWDGQAAVADFLLSEPGGSGPFDWVITNPPFRLAEAFIAQAHAFAAHGCAMLVRTSFLEGQARHDALFRSNPPVAVLQFVERVVMRRGVLLDPDVAVWEYIPAKGSAAWHKPTTATSYCWLIWDLERETDGQTRLDWIAPCRRALTRAGDYPPVPAHLLPCGGSEEGRLL